MVETVLENLLSDVGSNMLPFELEQPNGMKSDKNDKTKTSVNTYVIYTINRATNDDNVLTNSPNNKGDYPELSFDLNAGFSVNKVVSDNKYEFNFKIYSLTKSYLENIISELNYKFMIGNVRTMHSIRNTIITHDEMNEILYTIYKAMSYEVSFNDYLSDLGITAIKSINNQTFDLGYVENQINVLGRYTNSYSDLKLEYDEDTNKHYIELNYEVFINRPEYLLFDFQPIVNNIFIGKHLSNKLNVFKEIEHVHSTQLSKLPTVINHDVYKYRFNKSLYPITLPPFDVFKPTDEEDIFTVATLLYTVDFDSLYIINLRQLEYLILSPEIIAFIEKHYEKVTMFRETPLLIDLYTDERNSKIKLKVDSDLNVFLLETPDKRSIFRLSIKFLMKRTMFFNNGGELVNDLPTGDFTLMTINGDDYKINLDGLRG
jgi:hypothetical protein